MNVVLVARNEAALKTLASELEAEHGVSTRCVAADLSDPSPAVWARLRAAVEGLEVGVLVNNAGTAPRLAAHLEDQDLAFERAMMEINCMAPLQMARMVLPGMKTRRRGLIVSIGSGMGSMPFAPMQVAYGSSKRFVEHAMRSLNAELLNTGVRAQCMIPMTVDTAMMKDSHAICPPAYMPTAATWVASAMRFMGHEPVCVPYWRHQYWRDGTLLLPEDLVLPKILEAQIDSRRETLEVMKRQKAAKTE
ncbi:hypothetical protein H632_c200p1 [Helicosporidium sp. ATCC 50920]|nr:hypothetical protein H632_c200p1 [Helicosporidium sp. ATCC 50920]|eukprot:KDD76510.1 hypothetical protein H632_c200p1 [Helicosporidium sp. ATCC 50920]